jgi:predicted MPP superfamily phosphohydrolase
MDDIVIAHLSDLHLSTKQAEDNFEIVAEDVRQARPDVIVVTGDLVDHPRHQDFERVKERLERLWQTCGITDANCQIVIPGNHDYRWFGNIKLWRGAFDQLFVNWESAKLARVKDRVLAFFCFNSNTSGHFARGKVGKREYHRFNHQYNALQRGADQAAFHDAFRIALLHHHPLPIAEAELPGVTNDDAFLGLNDAGTFLQTMVEKRISLILHGHKHNPLYARLTLVASNNEAREIHVVGAGSASQADGRNYDCGYNLIRLRADGTIDLERKRARQGTFEEPWQHAIRSYEDSRNQAFLAAKHRENLSLVSEAHQLQIDGDGDCECQVQFRGLAAQRQASGLPFERRGVAGVFRELRAISQTEQLAHPQWLPDAAQTDNHLKGEWRFGQPLDANRPPLDFMLSFRGFNTFALTAEQGRRMNDEPADKDWEAFSVPVRHPLGTLFIAIRFPYPIQSEWFELTVTDQKQQPNSRELNWCRQHLRLAELLGTAMLVIPQPLLGYRYGLRWQLPPDEQQRQGVDRVSKGKAEVIRRELLKCQTRAATAPDPTNPLQNVFVAIQQELRQRYPSHDPAERLDVGLQVFDQEDNRLRHIAGVLPPAYWSWKLHEGEGVAGRAHKLNKALRYARAVARGSDWYTRPPDARPHELVLSVPLRYPVEAHDGWVVGVLSVASTSPASPLISLKNEKVNELIMDFYEDYFLLRILPTIGLQQLA